MSGPDLSWCPETVRAAVDAAIQAGHVRRVLWAKPNRETGEWRFGGYVTIFVDEAPHPVDAALALAGFREYAAESRGRPLCWEAP